MTDTVTGGCQCGQVRYSVRIHDDDAYLCHCRMCQRATGGVSIAFKSVKIADVAWMTREPDRYQSSPIARRGFCAACGTPLTFEFLEPGENMDLTVGSFDDPYRFSPVSHFSPETWHEGWLDTRHLPATRADENPSTRDRWIKAIGKLPIEPQYFDSFDGARLAWRELGPTTAGARPVVLIHGYFSNAQTNWLRYGHAAAIAAKGFRVIMPDLRGHGDSARPHDAAGYPPDVLMRDGLALVDRLGLSDYDLVGYSLGARTAVRMLANGAVPRRVVLSGMGLRGLTDTAGRGAYFRNILTHLGSFARGSNEWMTEAFLKTTGGDPVALLRILDTFVDTLEAEIRAIKQPVLVVAGDEDEDNGPAEILAKTLPNGTYRSVPGGHMSAVVRPELGIAIADFLAA